MTAVTDPTPLPHIGGNVRAGEAALAPRPQADVVEAIMNMNVGGSDRGIRVVLGLAILAVGVYFRSWWGMLGIVLLLTAAVGWCPLYLPFRFTTRPKKSATQG